MTPSDGDATSSAIERAATNVGATAHALGLTIDDEVATRLALAALATATGELVIEEDTTAGLWRVAETRTAIRRRLRDHAAVRALDAGHSLAAHPAEQVRGVGPAGESIPVDEADVAVVTHTYLVRPLLPRPTTGPEDDTTRAHEGAAERHPRLRLL